MTSSKKDLIKRLMEMYPYSEEWFKAQSEKRLWAMYYAYKPKKPEAIQEVVSTIVEYGTTYILTDAGVYEEMYD